MLSAKLLVFLTLQVITVLGLGNNALLNLPELDEAQLNWPQQKIQTIEYLLNTLSEVGNVTLVGWQQIWNSDGSLKEIRTIELTILSETPAEVVMNEESVNLREELPQVIETMKSLASSTGIRLSGSYVNYKSSGTPIEYLQVTADDIFIRKYGAMPFRERNIATSNITVIRDLVQTWENQSIVPVSVLDWNANGTINLQSSVIVPELLATVSNVGNASLSMLELAMAATVKAMLIHPENVTSHVAMYMKNSEPDFNWIVGQDWYVSTDSNVSVDIQYDPVPIGQQPTVINIIGLSI